MPSAHPWAFRSKLRRRAYGWRGSRKAIDAIASALTEILRAARSDPALAAEGAVILLEKIPPAVCEIDSSSGALGNAATSAVATVVPIIAAAPVARPLREKWLDRLFQAYQDDDPPYIESLGDAWGKLCAGPELASAWADRLLPGVRLMMADRRRGAFAFSKSTGPCLSALFAAGRFDELLDVLASDPRPFVHDQQWAARVLAARGDVDGAVNFIETFRRDDSWDGMLAGMAEKLLLDAGRVEEAYQRYAIASTQANTHVATFRAIAKRYPDIDRDRILNDLMASTPGDEGRWFATARTLGRFELALALARAHPVDPKTLLRAAQAQLKPRPAFALEVALAALRGMAAGLGYELTCLDAWAARSVVRAATEALGSGEGADDLVARSVDGEGAAAKWIRDCLRLV